MQKWEYCIVGEMVIYNSYWKGQYPKITYFRSNGVEEKEIRKEGGLDERNNLAKVISDLGEQGWEMVGIAQTSGSGSDHVLYFKRPA